MYHLHRRCEDFVPLAKLLSRMNPDGFNCFVSKCSFLIIIMRGSKLVDACKSGDTLVKTRKPQRSLKFEDCIVNMPEDGPEAVAQAEVVEEKLQEFLVDAADTAREVLSGELDGAGGEGSALKELEEEGTNSAPASDKAEPMEGACVRIDRCSFVRSVGCRIGSIDELRGYPSLLIINHFWRVVMYRRRGFERVKARIAPA